MPLDGRKTGSRVPETTKLAAVAYYRQHGSLKLTAEKYGMSIGTLATALKNHTTLGEVSTPSTRPRKGRSSRLDAEGIDLIRRLLEENPQMYLKDIKQRLEDDLGIQVDTSNICRQMKKARISRKALATHDPVQREAIERQEEEHNRQVAMLRAQQELERRYQARRQRLAAQRTPEQAQAAHDAAVAAAKQRAERNRAAAKQQQQVLASLAVQHDPANQEHEGGVPGPLLPGEVDAQTLDELALDALHTAHHPHLNLNHALAIDGHPSQSDDERAQQNALLQSSYESAMAQFRQETGPSDRRSGGGGSARKRRAVNAAAMESIQAQMHHDLMHDDSALMQEHLGDAYYTGNHAHAFDAPFDAATMRQLQGSGAEDDEDAVARYAGLQMEDGSMAIDPNMDGID